MAMSSESVSASVSESDPSILILLTELDKFVRSCDKDHGPFWLLGESSTLFAKLRLAGICMPLPILGEASGDASAKVV